MPTYTNQEEYVSGTNEADTFIYTVFPFEWATIDAFGGFDTLDVNIISAAPLTVDASDPFNTGTLSGRVQPYGSIIFYNEMEDVRIVGSSVGDYFNLLIGSESFALLVDFDGGAGSDTLTFNFSGVTEDMTFTVAAGTIVSSFGNFSNFERFEIYPDVPAILTINPDGKSAHRYQVRLLLELVEEYGLHMRP